MLTGCVKQGPDAGPKVTRIGVVMQRFWSMARTRVARVLAIDHTL